MSESILNFGLKFKLILKFLHIKMNIKSTTNIAQDFTNPSASSRLYA